MKYIKTYESLTSEKSLIVYHNSPTKINTLIKRPIWAALDLKEGICYYQNMIEQSGESYLYELKIVGNFFNDGLEMLLGEKGIDYYDFLSDLTANPSAEEILDMDAVKLLINMGYNGLVHEDYHPCDHSKDTDVILIFDPLVSVVSINPIDPMSNHQINSKI